MFRHVYMLRLSIGALLLSLKFITYIYIHNVGIPRMERKVSNISRAEPAPSRAESIPSRLEPAPADQIVRKFRPRFRRLVTVIGRGDVSDFDAYYRNHVINVYFKLSEDKPLLLLDGDDAAAERVRLHHLLAKSVCPYLKASQGARRVDISMVKEDLSDSLDFKIYKSECGDGT